MIYIKFKIDYHYKNWRKLYVNWIFEEICLFLNIPIVSVI